jgi:hypothetical protein
MPDETEDFATIIEKSQRVDKDMGSLFGTGAPGRVAFEPANRNAGADLEWDAHCDVFCIPADRDGYQDVLNQILHGEASLRYEERTFTKDGDFMVAICYLTPRERPRAAADEDAGDAEPDVRPHKMP